MRSWKPGDTLEVIDDAATKPGGRRPPFRKGAMVVVDYVSPATPTAPSRGVKVVGHYGYWAFNRFEVRRG